MRFTGRVVRAVRVLVMLVVGVQVFVLHRLVVMLVLVTFGHPQQALNATAHRLTWPQRVPSVRVEADAAFGRSDGHFIADGEHELLTEVERSENKKSAT